MRDPPGFGRCVRCDWRAASAHPRCWSCAADAIGRPSAWRPAAGCGRPAPRCDICDQVLADRRPCSNYWCRRDDRGFDAVWTVGTFDGTLGAVITACKHRARIGWEVVLGRILAGFLVEHGPCFDDVDLVVAMPSRPERHARGDPVAAVVDAAASVVGDLWEFDTGPSRCLVRTPGTVALAHAGSPASRRLWAAGDLRASLHVRRRDLEGQHVLVVDDVLTDGSSLREAAGALRRAGAGRVSGLVLARQTWRTSIAQPVTPRS